MIPPPAPALGTVPIEITLGPRNSWFTAASVHALLHTTWKVTEHTNRVGVRLQGQGPLHRSRTEELPSEGVVTGSIQVPPGGQPVVFLADHPVTGGYPVIAVVSDAGIASLAQLRPGSTITFKGHYSAVVALIVSAAPAMLPAALGRRQNMKDCHTMSPKSSTLALGIASLITAALVLSGCSSSESGDAVSSDTNTSETTASESSASSPSAAARDADFAGRNTVHR